MARPVNGSVVVVTGASSGIGRAAALEFARRGASVVLAARRSGALDEVAAECAMTGSSAVPVPTDVADAGAVDALAAAAVERYGRIDAWVNDASVSFVGRFEVTSPEVFRRVVDVNLFGVVNGSRAALREFRRHGQGTLINVASAYGVAAGPQLSAYAAAKHAVVGFSQALRMELRDAPGIDVCTVMPAAIDTPFFIHSGNHSGRRFKPVRPFYPPETVAVRIVDLVEHPRREVYAGAAAAVAALSRALVPSLYEAIYSRYSEVEHFLDEPVPQHDGNVFEPMAEGTATGGGWSERQPSLAGLIPGAGVAATIGLALGGLALLRARR